MGQGPAGGFTYNNVNAGNPRLYQEDVTVPVADQSKVLNSITFTYDSGSQTANILAISGTPTVPEPASAALVALAGMGRLARQRGAAR